MHALPGSFALAIAFYCGAAELTLSQVESFVTAVVRETIPNAFWGSKANADLIFSCSSLLLPGPPSLTQL